MNQLDYIYKELNNWAKKFGYGVPISVENMMHLIKKSKQEFEKQQLRNTTCKCQIRQESGSGGQASVCRTDSLIRPEGDGCSGFRGSFGDPTM